MTARFNIGLVGFGFIGGALYRELAGGEIEVTRVYDHTLHNIESLPPGVGTTDRDSFLAGVAGLDLVVELAHAEVTKDIGVEILSRTSYMPCSVAALADEALWKQLLLVAGQSGTRLYVPHGAVVGMDNLLEARSKWESVRITFRKPPTAIASGMQVAAQETLLFEGSVREIATRFPRSVNAMVACALATVGVEVAVARMFADSRFGNVLRGEFEFTGKDGSRLTIVKEEPGVGVSGVGMINSIKGSLLRALGITNEGAIFV